MSTLTDYLLEINIKVPDLVAGLLGGVVNAFVFKRSDPWSVIGSVVVGALTANYLAEPIARFLGLTAVGSAAFITGLAGMALCQGLIDAAKRWTPGPGSKQE